MAFQSTTETLNEFGTGIVNRFREVLAQKGANASGQSSEQAHYDVFIEGDVIRLKAATTSYFKYADEGRGKTVNSGDGAVKRNIRKWIDQKGISPNGINKDELAFLIARKIHREGFKGKLYIDDVVTPEFRRELKEQISKSLIEDINI